jgi:hypothetical protein
VALVAGGGCAGAVARRRARFALAACAVVAGVRLMSRRAGAAPPGASEREAGALLQVRLSRTALALPGGGTAAAFRVEDARSGDAVNAWRFAELLQSGADAQDALSAVVCDGLGDGSAAVFFEARPHDRASAQGPGAFEFVLLPAPALDRAAERASDFDDHLAAARAADRRVATFRNIGGDAVLVAPVPDSRVPSADYVHLSRFCRGSRPFPELSRALWSSVGAALLAQWSARPLSKVWLSTSGLGVYHLHVRLDARPKYYNWAAFK